MFNVQVTAATTRKVTVTEATPEGRDYSIELPGEPTKHLLWTAADKPYLATSGNYDPTTTHHVMASTVNIDQLAALALACLDELHRADYFTNDDNGPPPVQCAADVRAYINRQLVIAHNQAAANEANKAANDPPAAQAETDNQDWYLTSDEAPF